jgi:hypothetical protein
MPAAWVGAAVGLYSALSSGNSADNQVDATNQATELQKSQYDQARSDNMPALGARNDALTRLEELLGVGGDKAAPGFGTAAGSISPGDVTKDAGYQFGLDQGTRSLDSTLNARGMRDSGAALKAATRFGTDYATTKYDDAFNRQLQDRQQQLNPFLSLAGAGQVGTSQIGAAGQNYANQAGANAIAAGDARATGNLAQTSIYGNTANQLAGWYQNQRQPQTNYGAGAYYGANGNAYANFDLSGTNRGSGD